MKPAPPAASLLLLLTVFACTRPGDPFTDLALERFALVRDSITLGEWRRMNPGDSISLHPIAGGDREFGDLDECGNTESTIRLSNGGSVRQTAHFFLPGQNGAPQLPSASSEALIDSCRLAYLSLLLSVPDTQQAKQQQVKTSQVFAQRVTAPGSIRIPDIGKVVAWTGEADSARTGVLTWDAGALRIGLGVDFKSSTPTQSHPSIVLILQTRTVGSFDQQVYQTPMNRKAQAVPKENPFALVREALDSSGLPEWANAAIVAWRQYQLTPGADTDSSQKSRRVINLETGLARIAHFADSLPPQPRAALLYALNEMLEASPSYLYYDTLPHAALRAAGARYQEEHFQDAYLYMNDWLQRASDLRPSGRIGDLIYLKMVNHGFALGPDCHGGSYETIIREVEPYLVTHPNSTVSSELHLALARAYSDRVYLGLMPADSGSPPSPYAAQLPESRTNANRHYRAVLATGRKDWVADRAWKEGWQLLTGLRPLGAFYYCNPD